MTDRMTAEEFFAERDRVFGRANRRIAYYWRKLTERQRAALCYTASLPVSFASPDFPEDVRTRELLHWAAGQLDYYHKFGGAMDAEEWRTGLRVEAGTEKRPEATGPKARLERKTGLLASIVSGQETANSGQEKTQLNGACDA